MVGIRRSLSRLLIRSVLFVTGVGVIVWIFSAVGWPSIEANLTSIGPWFLPVAGLYLFAQLAFAAGWWVVLDEPPISFRQLFDIYLAGDAVNYLSPGGVAGEPLRAHLIGREMGLDRALATLTIHKHAELVAQLLFISVGISVALFHFRLPPSARHAILGGLACLLALVVFLTWAALRGSYWPALRRLSKWPVLGVRLQRFHDGARSVDLHMREFYASHRARFGRSVAWCFAGWCGGLLETYLLLRLLSPGESVVTAIAVDTIALVVNTLFLFVPARAGSAEGARVAAFVMVGLPAAAGAAYAVARRGREILWALGGLMILLRWQTGRDRKIQLREVDAAEREAG